MSLLAKNLLRAPPRKSTDVVEVPERFVDFCPWVGVELTPGQREVSLIAFDGEAANDHGLACKLFGCVPTPGRRRVVCAVCGRRGGKSYVFVALRLLHGMLVRKIPKLPPNSRAVALIIAPRDSMRAEVFRYAIGAVRSKPELAAMLIDEKVDSFTLRRPDGQVVSFETGVATAGGTAARSRWYTDFALDESAFFRDGSFKVNDEELFRAGSATLLPGGQVLVTSTPWAEAGLLYKFWKERPEGVIVVHAPTLLLNDSPETRDAVAQARAMDPDNAKREFDAEFMTSGTTVFFEGTTIDAAMVDEPFVPMPGDSIAAGGDFGFLSDSSALVMLARRGDVLHVYDGTEERPEDGAPLKPSRTVARFAEVIDGKCSYVMCDGHNLASILEHFEEHGLVYAPAPVRPDETHVRARMLLREGRIRIHKPNLPIDFVRRLEQQMREVHGKPTSGGRVSIIYPQWSRGGHGDICAAFVLAVWQVTGDTVPAPLPATGTDAWLETQREKRRGRLNERNEKKQRRFA